MLHLQRTLLATTNVQHPPLMCVILKHLVIALTLDILKHAKRFHATVSFIADTGLKEGMELVHKYNQLMKDFPLNELLSATDLDKIRESLHMIFGHLNKKLKLS